MKINNDVSKELEKVHKSLQVFAAARQLIIIGNKDIVKACRESINASHSANSALPGNQDDKLKKSQEKAFKAANLLKKLHKRLKTDYGKSWRQDLNEFLFNSEQEVVEAFSLFAIINQEQIPTRDISFRFQHPDSYKMVKTTIQVSERAYVFGLLDCIGELKRVILDSMNRNDIDFSRKVYEQMQDLFGKLEIFTEYSNSVFDLKPKIDAARHILNDTKKILDK